MIIRFFTPLLLSFLFSSLLVAQPIETSNKSFLPTNLGPSINTEYPEINPVLSTDGKILYFNRINHPDNYYGKHNSQDIWFSYLQPDGSWSVAKRLDVPFNKARHNAIVEALNQETYLIDGIYSKGKVPKWRKRGLSIVTKNNNDQWSIPQKLKIKGFTRLNEGKESNAWMSSDRKALLLSFTHHYNGNKNNLYVSLYKDGKWTKPKKLNKTVNSRKSNEEAPFISYNNDAMYFSSNRGATTKKERKSNYQIYKSNRLDETWKMWSTPMPLSDTINSKKWDSYFRTNEKGNWGYFASTSASLGQSDIFKVKLFEDNPYVVVSGQIINKAKNAPLAKGKSYTVLANGAQIDSIWINSDSATYKVKLPLNKKYTLVPTVKNYTGIEETIDVTGVREYTAVTRDLYVEPLPYVIVSGHLMVRSPSIIVPQESNPKITINGKVVDSIKIKYPEGAYEIALPYGKSYTIAVQASKYIPEPVKLDFSQLDEYQEVKKELFVKKNAMAVISGSFFVKGTTKPLPSKSFPKLMVNGEVVDSAIIDTAKSTYKIVLSLKKSYSLNVSALKYQGIAVPVDLTTTNDQIELTKNIYATFVSNSALVTGKIINRKTNLPLSTTEKVEIQTNGQVVPNATYNAATSQYEVELPLGTSHTINALLPKHFPQYEILDLTKEKGNVKVIKDLYVTPLEVGLSVKLNNIFFETGKATLKPKSFPELNKVVKFLNENPTINIQIEGHTDNVGKADANLKLSRWRARAVQQYLIKKGIAEKQVKFDGFGSNKPVANNKTAQGRSLNRRVEFKILSVN